MSATEATEAPPGPPERLPLFPLTGALLLPRGQLPLNIFEPRYLQMVEHAMAGDRFIGMVQPTEHEDSVECPALYGVGCAGRITSFEELDDGRYLISLSGRSRFRIVEELEMTTLYRQARVSYLPFAADLATPEGAGAAKIDRERLLMALRAYLRHEGSKVDGGGIEDLDAAALVTSLAMACPFEPSEKQALLEAGSLSDRARALTTLIEMAALSITAGASTASQ
ncbi:MAG: LON peptidase substrate-binding domain-containing protein [Alphaproteobacteria bacterium]